MVNKITLMTAVLSLVSLSSMTHASENFVSEGLGMQYQESMRGAAPALAALTAIRNAENICGGFSRAQRVSQWTFTKVDQDWVKARATFKCQ